MDRAKLLLIVKASMAAAAAVVKLTPSTTDDKLYAIAQLIVDRVLEIYSETKVELSEAEAEAVAFAVHEVRSAL